MGKYQNTYQFINPYNFVPISSKEPKRTVENEKKEELYSGKINYTLKTVTPLFIPNTSNSDFFQEEGDFKKEGGKERYQHPSYDFFSYTDLSESKDQETHVPVIPGSEIRGAVRSVYESLTNSCLSGVGLKRELSRRTTQQYQAGIIEKNGQGKYVLYAAKDYLYRENKREDFSVRSFENETLPPDGSKVCFECDTQTAPDRPWRAKPFACNIRRQEDEEHKESGSEGYMVKGERGPEITPKDRRNCGNCPDATKQKCDRSRCYFMEKHCAHVFEKKPSDKNGQVLNEFEDVKKRMNQVLKLYKKYAEDQKRYGEYAQSWEHFLNGDQDGIPVYYSKIVMSETKNNRTGEFPVIQISPACITRDIYTNTMENLLGVHEPCEEREKLCPACMLFGTVQSSSGLKVASKIRFSDLTLDKNRTAADCYEEKITLPELSSPKISTTEFYLKKPEAQNGKSILNWTYDYYTEMDDKGNVKLVHYVPEIAGRKFYWHDEHAVERIREKNRTKSIKKTERNRTVRPVTSKVCFHGTLYFDKITATQLRELTAILNISNEAGKKYALKIGAGKPLGFGSVELRVDEVWSRKVCIEEADGKKTLRYIEEKPDPVKGELQIARIFKDNSVLKMLRIDAIGDGETGYPVDRNKPDEGFAWFEANRSGFKMDKSGRLSPEEVKGLLKREQVYFKEYLKALETRLSKNEIHWGRVREVESRYQKPRGGNPKQKGGNSKQKKR